MTITDRDMRTQITAFLDAGDRAELFDVAAITDELIGRFGLVDIDTIDSALFWDVVAAHDTAPKAEPAPVSKPSLAERMRDAAVRNWEARQTRDRTVSNLVRSDWRSERWTNVIEIARPPYGEDVTTGGAYVVEITPNVVSDFDIVTYATVINGRSDHLRFRTVEMALLHAIARRAGQADGRADPAHYAGKVLGVTDVPRD